MKATFLIIFILVVQVFADSPRIAYDDVDSVAYEASVDSTPIHTEEPLDSLQQEDLLNGSCQSLKEHSELIQNAYRMQRDSLSKKERREHVQLMDRQLDSVANVCHLGIYGRSQLGYYTPRRIFAFDLSFFMAMPTIDDSFNKIRFYGGDISVKATTSKGDFGLGFSVGYGKNEGDDIHYEDIYHKGGETAGGVTPYLFYGYPVLDNTDHKIVPTVKLCYYSGSSGDESIPAEDDTHKQFFYSLGIRYEYTINAPVDKEEYHKGLLHDAVFATINFGFDVNMYAADVIAKAQREADNHPEDGNQSHGDKRLQHGGDDILSTHHTAVEERQSGGHHQYKDGSRDQPGHISGRYHRPVTLKGRLAYRQSCQGDERHRRHQDDPTFLYMHFFFNYSNST